MNNLLVVDDEEHLLKSISRVLRRQPFHCFTAKSAQEALEILNHTAIDVVISDYNMPTMAVVSTSAVKSVKAPSFVSASPTICNCLKSPHSGV